MKKSFHLLVVYNYESEVQSIGSVARLVTVAATRRWSGLSEQRGCTRIVQYARQACSDANSARSDSLTLLKRNEILN